MSANAATQGVFDYIAKGREDTGAVWAGGTDLWTRYDAAADETFENRMKGSDATAADAQLQSGGANWSSSYLRQQFLNLNTYIRTDLALASWTAYLESVGWRVPYQCAEAYYEAMGGRLASQFVFPKGTRPADEADPSASGMHLFGTWATTATYTSVDGALPSTVKGAPVLVVPMDTGITGGSTPQLTATLQDGTTKDIAMAIDGTKWGHGTGVLGEGKIGVGGAAAGQKDVLIKTAVTQFKAGEYVLIEKADGSAAEVACISSINTLTLTMVGNLVNTFLEDALVMPMFTNVTRKQGTVSAASVNLYARPDRIIAV